MKKSLLSLLVVTLTVVGCQNYDDQFDVLNSKIAELATSVGELDSIRSTISTLSSDIATLSNTTASASDLADLMIKVAALTTAMDAVETVSEEVEDLDEEVETIIEALNDLLSAASVIQQDIVISSEAQLEYVEELMNLDITEDNTYVADTTIEWILNGNLTVDAEFSTTAALGTRLQNVMARFSSVIIPDEGSGVTIDSGSAAATGADLDMKSLRFVQGQVSLAGANALEVPALNSLTATLTLGQDGAIAFPALNQVGNVRITSTGTITSINFSSVSTGGVIETSPSNLANAALDGAVDLGKLDLPANVDLAKATSIKAGGAPNGVTISAPLANSIDLVDTTPFAVTGIISITAKGHVTINAKSITNSLTISTAEGAIRLDDLKTAGLTTLTASSTIHAGFTSNAGGIVASGTEVHFAALKASSATLTISAGAVDLSKLESATGVSTLTVNTAAALNLAALTDLSVDVVAPAVTDFDAGALIAALTASGTVYLKAGADVLVKNLTVTTTLFGWDNITVLTLTEQGTNIDFTNATSMTTLNYTGKDLYNDNMDTQTNMVTITSDAITTLNVDGFVGTLHVNGANGLAKLTTGGNIINVEVANNTALDELVFGHDHVDKERAATIHVSGNNKVESLNLKTVNKVKTIHITGNSSLTALTMAGYSPYAESGATISVTIAGNALVASYKRAKAGSETGPYDDASLTDTTGLLCSVADFINYYAVQKDIIGNPRTGLVSMSINLQFVTDDAATPVTSALEPRLAADTAALAGVDGIAGGADAEVIPGGTGGITTLAEMNFLIDTCP
jgi:prefoldin subunit 5/Cu/Ag efflux protein CusF